MTTSDLTPRKPIKYHVNKAEISHTCQNNCRRDQPLEEQLAPKNIYYNNPPESRRDQPLEEQLAPKNIYYKNPPESRRSEPSEEQPAPKNIKPPESQRNEPLEEQPAPKNIKPAETLRDTDPKQYWKLLKSLKYENTNNKIELQAGFPEIIDHFKHQGETVNYDKEFKTKIETDILNETDALLFNEVTDKPFTINEVNKCIQKLKTGKSSGPDQISNEIIKYSGVVTCKAITKLFNLILDSGAIGDPCITKPCANGGKCTWKRGKDPNFTCKCALGYKGKFCQESVPECGSQPCKEKGSCVSTPKGFICMCTDGFRGIYCEDKTMKNKTDITITPEELYEVEIGLGIFSGLVVVIIIILVIHFIRVNKRRENMVAQYKHLLSVEETHPPLPPGIFEVSNLLCYELFCFACPKWSESLTKYASKEVLQKASSRMEEEPLMNRQSLLSMKKSLDSVWRGSFEEQKPKYRTTRDRPQSLDFPKQNSSTRPKSYSSLPMQMSHIDQQYSWLPRNYDRSAFNVEQPDEIVNIEHVQSQESLLSRQSSRVLPRIQPEMSPRSNRPFQKRSSTERPWSYDVDPYTIQSRRKSLRHHSPHDTSSATHDEIADLYDRISHSRHEIPSQNNQHSQYLENVASEYRPQQFDQSLEQMESEYRRLSRRQSPNRRSSTSSNRHYMPIPPPPPPPPPQIPRDSGIDRKYGSSLIRRLSSKFDQGQYTPPAPPVPPPPPFTIDD
ncbi:unnamed protein product [Mytilus coruscus]|uniref:EGF-like domain-containing protein n=1 Tax=Mytilus coruscus TaxID=42192 RepID=A0A6J8DZU1_MYTCO|nr:unnamed protein product [Mytilus coruscus]